MEILRTDQCGNLHLAERGCAGRQRLQAFASLGCAGIAAAGLENTAGLNAS